MNKKCLKVETVPSADSSDLDSTEEDSRESTSFEATFSAEKVQEFLFE